ncbi:Histidine kinase [Friedmanniella luteola]|uniref:Histidine kinase n=1 Tax=Friedmanniella luteola TaxID=546871 RepID=A0A1H1X2I1_9ACTN|nr:GAF domain-containing protein [Friedmanniella luteola]SDT03544.1 Histidine kinase [Friedmanniella luteola]
MTTASPRSPTSSTSTTRAPARPAVPAGAHDAPADGGMEASEVSTRLRLLMRESAAVVEELSLPSLHRRVVEAAHRLVGLPDATLAVLDADGSVVQLVQRDDDLAVVGCLPLDPADASALTSGLRGLKAATVARLAGDGLPAPWSAGCTAFAVHHRRHVLAVLLVVEPEGGLTTEDEDVLLGLASSAGTAIENARLYEEARRRQEWLQEAAELSNGTLAVVTETEAVALVARSVQKLADAELVTAWVPEPDRQQLRPAVGLGDRAETLAGLALQGDDPLVAEVLAAGRGAHLDVGDRTGSACLDGLAALGIGPVLVLPVHGVSGLRGLLLAGRHVSRPPFGAVDLDMAETFLGHVAMALDLIRARAVHQRVAQLEDRDRIARDLHDHVASSLLSTGTKVQDAAGRSRDLRIRRLLHEVSGDLDLTLHRLRDSIFALGSAPGSTPVAEEGRTG